MRKAVDISNLEATIDADLPAGGFYYEYILIRFDNLMIARRQEYHAMQDIYMTYKIKKDNKISLPYGLQDLYIGSQIIKSVGQIIQLMTQPNG